MCMSVNQSDKDTIISIAGDAMRLLKTVDNVREKICGSSAYWVPLTRLYEVMISEKELPQLKTISKPELSVYWKIATTGRPDKHKSIWIMICQAMYVYEFIIKKM